MDGPYVSVAMRRHHQCGEVLRGHHNYGASSSRVSLSAELLWRNVCCWRRTKEDITGKTFDWKKDERRHVFMYNSGIHSINSNTGQDQQFIDRVSHFQDQLKNGNASIKITKTEMADSGTYSCDFPRLQPRQTFNIELVVDQVLRDRTGEKSGAAPKPYIDILYVTKDRALLQCEARGVPLPTVEWKDSDNKTLHAEKPQISERGGRSYITVKITVTKNDTYRCVATQKEISHQISAVIPVHIPGSSAGWIFGGVVCLVLVVGGVGLCINNRKKN
ncbi:V-set domain-containing T-cell activation inhibitor 1-like [Pagrus major]|uniref:V-set domain-containing T-cell activation inhibitor 1-like n=1 Tax=Pagrus major TaxID=143350 RepID=UPI003CC8574D